MYTTEPSEINHDATCQWSESWNTHKNKLITCFYLELHVLD